jgi:hypothetical protein
MGDTLAVVASVSTDYYSMYIVSVCLLITLWLARTESKPGEVIRVVKTELYQWCKYTVPQRHGSVMVKREIRNKLAKVEGTWSNIEKGFFMNCAQLYSENGQEEKPTGQYRAIIYVPLTHPLFNGRWYKAIKTMDVTSCENIIVSSIRIKIKKTPIKKDQIIIVDKQGKCTMYEHYHFSGIGHEKECPSSIRRY